MKDFIENFGKVVLEKAEVVTKKTGEVVEVVAQKAEKTVEVQKIKGKISNMERINDKDYKRIGKMVCQKFKKGDESMAVFAEICEAIAQREEDILALKKEIADIKGMELCPKCSAYVDANAKFCPNCGEKTKKDAE